MSKGHRHATLMAEYARIAAEHKEPWKFIEWLDADGKWNGAKTHPVWDLDTEYRLKPRTIRIGEIDVPEPMRGAPEFGSVYFVADPITSKTAVKSKWDDCRTDRLCLDHGLCHTTEEAAIAHAKALILVSGGKVALGQFGRL